VNNQISVIEIAEIKKIHNLEIEAVMEMVCKDLKQKLSFIINKH